MNGPDRDAWLPPLVEEAFENSEKRYGTSASIWN
mgnify:CR=1 FL=1